ncbi:Hsp33 family molecular chaperone HslO [Croceibacterium ferulae]|uniref:Hsp33 family molecular chaperone HslO n=1 Tax=Croceibacterium ferulae TaxID=1854641 RepID=UPI0019D4E4FC|nr:Hsp33 family molecular chaperone HslO [Croceibacterium ferulae]
MEIEFTAPYDIDQVLTFSLPDKSVRGRVARLGPVLGDILQAHDYPPVIRLLLSEALVITTLMGSLIQKSSGQLTIQVQSTSGAVELLVCDFLESRVRGYVQFRDDVVLQQDRLPDFGRLFGDGRLVVTFDMAASKERYQGLVELRGSSLTQVVRQYFIQSEQIPTVLQTAIDLDGPEPTAAGMLLQYLPDGEEGRTRLDTLDSDFGWACVAQLAETTADRDDALLAEPGLRSTLRRLFPEEDTVMVHGTEMLAKGCRCSLEHYDSILSRFSKEDRREMQNEDGVILVDCAFCARQFAIQD